MSKRHGLTPIMQKPFIAHMEIYMFLIMIHTMLRMSDRLTGHHEERHHEGVPNDPILEDQGVPLIAPTPSVIEAPKRS